MTVLEVIQRSSQFLQQKGIESPRLQAELLLAHVLSLPRLQLYLDFQRTLTEPQLEMLRSIVKRRSVHEPLQHILGSTSFCGLEMKVNANVLTPRPETEILAERAWTYLNVLASREVNAPRALDFGTGSGCIAIALAAHCPAAIVVGLDISLDALTLAKTNASLHQLQGRITFLCADTLTVLRPGCADLVVSNPPYIASPEIKSLQPEVRDFDPHAALDGGLDGLDFYRKLASEAALVLKQHGRLMLEMGDNQSEAVSQIFSASGWDVESIEPDYTGRPRVLIARRMRLWPGLN